MFIVFSNRCMHLGCPVDATLTGFACPCHGGQYNKEGQRIAGPPIRPLDRFQWQLKNSESELWITQRWSVDFNSSGQIQYYKVKGPGQPVTVPWGGSTVANILYPRSPTTTPRGVEVGADPRPRHQADGAGQRGLGRVSHRLPHARPQVPLPQGAANGLVPHPGLSLLTVFILQAVTGMLLAMTYDPSPTGAYESIRYITDVQTLGWLLRGMHKWAPR